MSALHEDEIEVTEDDARRLVDTQTGWADRALRPAGHGTDNKMFRLGTDMAVRLPRRPGTARDVAKEQRWLPVLHPQLPLQIPEPLFCGKPDRGYPFAWSVLRWVQGSEPAPGTIDDWAMFGRDLGAFVEALHGLELAGATRRDALSWYRGDRFTEFAPQALEALAEVRALAETERVDLDLSAVERFLREASAAEDPVVPDVWLHGDLRAANLVADRGRLTGVIDFGALSIGNPTAEHAAIWEFPQAARDTYRERLALDEATWLRAAGWAVGVSLLGIPYYWHTWPEFARDGVRKIRRVLGDA